MKEHLNNIVLLGLVAIIILTLSDKCGREPEAGPLVNQVAEIKRYIDSVVGIKDKTIDSLVTRSMEQDAEIKLVRIQKAESDRQLSIAQRTAARLASGVVIAKANSDTAGYILHCDSLSDHVTELNIQIDGYRHVNDQLVALNDSLISTKDALLKEREELNSTFRGAFNKVNMEYDDLFQRHQKAVKKSNRKYALTFGGGGGVTPKLQVQPVVGLFVGRIIARF